MKKKIDLLLSVFFLGTALIVSSFPPAGNSDHTIKHDYNKIENSAHTNRSLRSIEDSLDVELTDHHVHIFSPRDRSYLIQQIDGLDSLPPLGLNKYLKIMKRDAVEKAAILSTAYFFSTPGENTKENFDAVQADNNRIAKAITKHPDTLAGFFSVNPLSDSVFVEMDRNAGKNIFSGLKLQLANSGVNLRNQKHLRRLGKVFKKANSMSLGMVVHMRSREKPYGRKDARLFIDSLLAKAPDIPIQIAHAAGWGGYDVQTDHVLGVFANRSSNDKLGEHIYFDISAVIRPVKKQDSTATPEHSSWYPEKRYDRLAKQLRRIGLNRILFGTDWPDWSPADYKADIMEQLPLSKEELRIIFANRAPWFKD